MNTFEDLYFEDYRMQKLIFLDIDGVLNVETYHYLEENDIWVCPEAGDTEFPLLYGDQPLNSRCLKIYKH